MIELFVQTSSTVDLKTMGEILTYSVEYELHDNMISTNTIFQKRSFKIKLIASFLINAQCI